VLILVLPGSLANLCNAQLQNVNLRNSTQADLGANLQEPICRGAILSAQN